MSRRGVASRYERFEQEKPQAALRRIFRSMNRGMTLLWRLGLGCFMDVWPAGFGRLLVIEHVGRRTGAAYRTPVNYTTADGDIYCVAAFGTRTDWYRNALALGNVSIWLPDGTWEASIEDASDDPDRLDLMRAVLIDSGFAAPLFGLYPRRMTDEELADTTAGYRLVRIRRQRKLGGHADLAWVWPVGLGVILLLRVLGRRIGPLRRAYD
jgi:deazaflavin-dependent oxidoreductase (nitroreductase family)